MSIDAGAEADLPEGAMRAVDLDGQAVLLARTGGRCHAVGNRCPHAGGPLDQGVLDGGTVICPWHKAAFDLRTGQCLEPPAVDGLPRFTVHSEAGRLHIALPPAPLPSPLPTPARGADPRCFVMIGAGAAGVEAARTLRDEGFTGRVLLLSPEQRLPYDRTIQSKYVLSGKHGGEKSPLHDDAFYARHAIERRTATVTAIDPAASRITLSDGTALPYDAALLAPGGVAKRPPIPGADLPGVFTLRSAADAGRIVEAARAGRRAVVLGAGFVGMEAAAALRERGLAVTVVAPQPEPFEPQLGAAVGAVVRRLHERQGVAFRLDDEATSIEPEGKGLLVRLKHGPSLPADLVVAGLGIAPATSMLLGVPLRKDGGVDVDARLHLTGGLFAAGDIAAFPAYGTGPRIRVEHWRVAMQHGRLAALNMLGHGQPYRAAPVFWTIHFMKRLDYVGHAERWDDVAIEGETDGEAPSFLAYYLQSGRVAALAGWDRDRAMARAIPAMTARQDWTVATLRAAIT